MGASYLLSVDTKPKSFYYLIKKLVPDRREFALLERRSLIEIPS